MGRERLHHFGGRLPRPSKDAGRFVAKTVIVAALCGTLAPGAHAQALFGVDAGNNIPIFGGSGAKLGVTFKSDTETGSSATATWSVATPLVGPGVSGITSTDATATANAGGLHASGTGAVSATLSGNVGKLGSEEVAQASAFASYDDFKITGPPGSCVEASANLSLSGSVFANGNVFSGTGDATNKVTISAFGSSGTYLLASGVEAASGSAIVPVGVTGTGLLAGGIGGTLTTATLCFPVGSAFNVDLFLAVSADALLEDDPPQDENPAIQAVTDLGDTLTFNTNGPVFNLPPGYTVNSVEAGIVNNVFTLGAPAPAAVPEPGSVTLLGTGFAIFWLTRRRKKVS